MKLFHANGLSTDISIYTTRPHGKYKETSTYTLSLWMPLLVIMLGWINAVIWLGIALWEAGRIIF